MSTDEMSTVVSSNVRRYTIVNLKQVNQLPLRNALQTFDKNGDGKIDISELQKIVYWYGLWKYASIGLCLIVMTLVWATFGVTIWAIDLTKDGAGCPPDETGEEMKAQFEDLNQRRRLGLVDDVSRLRITGSDRNDIRISAALKAAFAAAPKMAEKKVAGLNAAVISFLKENPRRRLKAGDKVEEINKTSFMGADRNVIGDIPDDLKAAYAAGMHEKVRDELEEVFRTEGMLPRRRLETDFDALKNGLKLNLRNNGGWAKLAADYAVDAADAREDLEEIIKSNNLHPRRRLQVDQEEFKAFEKGLKINSVDFGGHADLDARSAALSPEKKRAFEGLIWMPGVHDRRRLQDIGVAETDFLNIVDMGYAATSNAAGNAVEAADAVAQEYEGFFEVIPTQDRRRLTPELAVNPNDMGYGDVEAAGFAVQGAPAVAQEYEGHFADLTNPRRRLPLPKFKLNPHNKGGRVADNAFPAAVQAADAKKQGYEDGLEVLNRRRLQPEFELNPTDMGYGADVVANYAAQAVTDAVDPTLMASHDNLIRRRLNEVVATIGSFDFNPNDSGSQVEGTADAAIAEDEAADPNLTSAWERGYNRRRLGLFDDIVDVNMGLVDFGGRATDAAQGLVQEAAEKVGNELQDLIVDDELERRRLSNAKDLFEAFKAADLSLHENARQAGNIGGAVIADVAKNAVSHLQSSPGSYKVKNDETRRRFLDLDDVVEVINDVDVNPSDFDIQAVDAAADALVELAEDPLAVVEQFEGFTQSGRRRLQSEYLNLYDRGYYIQNPQNAAQYTPINAPNAGPAFESDGSYRVDSPRRRFQDESLIQTDRRRLPSQGQLGSVGAAVKSGPMTNGLNDYVEMLKYSKVDNSMDGGVSDKVKAMLNQVAEEMETGRRRLAANVVGKVGVTDILSTYNAGYYKDIQQQLEGEPMADGALEKTPAFAGEIADYLTNGRRRLQGPLDELISVSANSNESGIGAGLQVGDNNAVESDDNGTGPDGVDAVVSNF